MRYIVGIMMVAFLGGGVMLIWHGLRSLLQAIRRRPYLVSVEGVVLNVHRERRFTSGLRRRRRSNIHNFPVIQFRTPAGEAVSFRSEVGDVGQKSRYYSGQIVPVRYDPEGQMSPMLNSWSGVWLPSIALLGAGLVFIGGAAMIWFAFGDKILRR